MSKRARTGDVIEIPTKRGLAYGQYSLRHHEMGALLSLLPGFCSGRPRDFSEMVVGTPRFVTFFPVGAAVHRGVFSVVAQLAVPDSAQKLPLFKSLGHIDRRGRIYDWWLQDGQSARRIARRLPQEYRSLPFWEIINDTLLIERLEEGWTPELEVRRIEARGAGDAPPWSGLKSKVCRLLGLG